MVEITIELTRRCNLACAHCLRDFREAADLPLPLLEHILSQVDRYKVEKVGFTGGEPTLHPHFAAVLALLAQRGLNYHFVTNGSTFPAIVPLLRQDEQRERFQFVVFSLEGSRAELHDAIRGPASFRSVMQAISLCHVHGLRFGLSVVIGRHNRDDLDQIALLASQLGAEFITFDHVHPTPDNVRQGIPLPLAEWRRAEQDVARLGRLMQLKVVPCQSMYHPDPLYVCPNMAGTALHVNHRGELLFCCALSGYRDGRPLATPRRERVADLAKTPLTLAHRRWLELLHELQCFRLERLAKDETREADGFPCLSCHRYFDQLSWTEEY